VRKHLRYHKWVVHIDADTIPLDYSLPLSGIVDEGYDVIVQWMDNGQLAAGGVVFKNTAKSWLFMDRWISKGNVTDPPGAGPNADNGDLVELLTEMFPWGYSVRSSGGALGIFGAGGRLYLGQTDLRIKISWEVRVLGQASAPAALGSGSLPLS
jgi:hypothetical protein